MTTITDDIETIILFISLIAITIISNTIASKLLRLFRTPVSVSALSNTSPSGATGTNTIKTSPLRKTQQQPSSSTKFRIQYQTLLTEKQMIEEKFHKLQHEMDALQAKTKCIPSSSSSVSSITPPVPSHVVPPFSTASTPTRTYDPSAVNDIEEQQDDTKAILFSPLSPTSPSSPSNVSLISSYNQALQIIMELENTIQEQKILIQEKDDKLRRYASHNITNSSANTTDASSTTSSSSSTDAIELQTYRHEIFILKDRLHLLNDERNTLIETIASLQSLIQRMDTARFTYERQILECEEQKHTLQQQLTELSSNYQIAVESNVQLIEENQRYRQRIQQLRTEDELKDILPISSSSPSIHTVSPSFGESISSSTEKKKRILLTKPGKLTRNFPDLFELSPEPAVKNGNERR